MQIKQIGMPLQRVSQLRQGDVIAIPLRQRLYAFGRVYREPRLAVFDSTGARLASLEEIAAMKVLFHIGFIQTKVQTCDWIYLGKLPFANAEDAWPPPVFIRDIIDPSQYRIYHRGEMKPATKGQTAGLRPFETQPPIIIRKRILEELARGKRSK